jgi:hypothetical protein
MSGVHVVCAVPEPNSRMKIRNPAIDTMLLTIGAQVYGPYTRRAFSDSPTRAKRP